jgi:hypothetical protein
MPIFIHGTDKGNAMVTSLVLIILLSTIFLSLVPRITAISQYTHEYKSQVLQSIEQSNREALILYDFY